MAPAKKESLCLGGNKREIREGMGWSLSTSKPGNGVEQLQDDNLDTYWQSDGGQPHLINIQFHKKMSIVEVAFYLDYKLDESYTPKKISIRAGTTFNDLVEVQVVELHEPSGWICVPLFKDGLDQTSALRASFIQICIVTMHQNGRDTHVRQVKVFGERVSITKMELLPEFSTIEFSQFSCIR